MFIDEVDRLFLEVWIKHSAAMKFVLSVEGKFVWANDEFLDWSGYSIHELQSKSFSHLSSDGSTIELFGANEYDFRYSIKRQCTPKNERPIWGTLTVMKFPPSGDIKCCGCTWEPLQNGTAVAFSLAIERYESLKVEVSSMNESIKSMLSQTEEDKWIVSTIAMVRKYPKLSVSVLVVAMSIFGANNVIELLQRTGFLPVPHIDPKLPAVQTQGVAFHNIEERPRMTTAVTPAGWEFSWSPDDDRIKSVSNIYGQQNPKVDGGGSSDSRGHISYTARNSVPRSKSRPFESSADAAPTNDDAADSKGRDF